MYHEDTENVTSFLGLGCQFWMEIYSDASNVYLQSVFLSSLRISRYILQEWMHKWRMASIVYVMKNPTLQVVQLQTRYLITGAIGCLL